jgi:ornithine cyclodeaminase/alanine dehydrogenase-like protein (mu-crystallin family)
MSLGIGIVGGGFNAQFHIRAFLQVRDCNILGKIKKGKKENQEESRRVRRVE